MAVNLRNFKLNSNYPMDNVVYSWAGNKSRSGSTWLTTTQNHGLSFTPLVFGLFSTDGGTSWRQIDFTSQTGGGSLISDSTKITINIQLDSGLPASIPIRLYAFAPSTYTGAVVAPDPRSNFYLNTDWTYDTLVAKGKYTLTNTNSLRTVYTHNLGYVPRVMIWIEHNDGSILSCVVGNEYDTLYYTQKDWVRITSTQLLAYHYSVPSSALTTDILHYRIYGGQNG